MNSIMESIFYGTICGNDICAPKKEQKEKTAAYDKVAVLLDENGKELLDELIELVSVEYDMILERTYRRAFATGLLLTKEAYDEIDKENNDDTKS